VEFSVVQNSDFKVALHLKYLLITTYHYIFPYIYREYILLCPSALQRYGYMVFSPQGQSGRDVRLTTRLRVSAGVTTLPIYFYGTHRNKFTSYPHLSSFLYLSFLFYLYLGYCSFVAGIMAQDGNNHWTIRVSVFPYNSAYLNLHKSHENLLLLSRPLISEQYFLTNDETCLEISKLSLQILSPSSCKTCELFTKTLIFSEKPTNNNHKIQGASASELSTIP